MSSKKLIVIALAGALATGVAQAANVQWSVAIGVPVPLPILWPGHVHPPVIHSPVPVVVEHHPAYRPVVSPRWDRDGDRVPNRYDRVYNPRWDRDGDGIPNRYDRVYNPRWDRDGDGIPNWRDAHDGRGHRVFHH